MLCGPRPGYTRPYLCPDVLMERTCSSQKSHLTCGHTMHIAQAAYEWPELTTVKLCMFFATLGCAVLHAAPPRDGVEGQRGRGRS